MRLLLDTHVLIWSQQDNRKLGKKARALILDSESELWLSAVSAWEIALKTERDRLEVPRPVRKWLPTKMRENDIRALAVTVEHAITAAELPRHHDDPFDRMLIAQAQVEDLRILTADMQFERYDVRLIDATV